MKILTLSNLYPNKVKPTFGIFVENRLKALLATGEIETMVVSPKPWFPLFRYLSSEYASLANIPAFEVREGIKVYYPRYLHIPKLGMLFQPFFMALCLWGLCRKLRKQGFNFQLIDAHYFYPDGVAASKVGKWLDTPVLITSRGSDVNEIARYPKAKEKMLQAAEYASHLVTVSEALRQKLISLGVAPNKITTLRNGVDLEKFRCSFDREALRKKLGVKGTRVISVGNLIPLKGHHIVIEAIEKIPDAELVICGDGPLLSDLKVLAGNLGLSERVIFLGRLGQDALIEQYQAADVLVLASENEGWPNVLLEAMACGASVVATNVGGVPEILAGTELGEICQRTPEDIARSIRKIMALDTQGEQARSHAEKFSWHETSAGQKRLFMKALDNRE